MLPKILVFASGSSTGGGSGFENLVRHSREAGGDLKAEIVGVVSNNEHGGVRLRADALKIPFIYFSGPYDAEHYRALAEKSGAEWFVLSGWLKKVQGLDPKRTFNIHPALLSILGGHFGGKDMYGHHVLDAVYGALKRREVNEFGISMHFVTDEYDRGPVFFEHAMTVKEGMTKEEMGEKVHKAEHEWQPKITNMVVHGEIEWDGSDPQSLKVPS